jgi:hypothetical protein
MLLCPVTALRAENGPKLRSAKPVDTVIADALIPSASEVCSFRWQPHSWDVHR